MLRPWYAAGLPVTRRGKPMDEVLQDLRVLAQQGAQRAYAPYSGFPVGAAVLAEDDRTWAGCNVENASFGLTQCAERTAIAAAIADGARPGALRLLVIYTPGQRVHSPCGACRQVMQELMAPDSRVISCCDTEDTLAWTLPELLPDPFSADALLPRDSR